MCNVSSAGACDANKAMALRRLRWGISPARQKLSALGVSMPSLAMVSVRILAWFSAMKSTSCCCVGADEDSHTASPARSTKKPTCMVAVTCRVLLTSYCGPNWRHEHVAPRGGSHQMVWACTRSTCKCATSPKSGSVTPGLCSR